MKLIDEKLLDSLTAQAKENPRLRMNHNFHEDLNDHLNRLLNAIEPDSYVRPHRHLSPDKEEIFMILRGSAALFIFDDAGNITSKTVFDPKKGSYGAEIEPGIWHSLLVLEPGTVAYEIKRGPFAPLSPDNLASWSPDPSDIEGVNDYMEYLRKTLQ